MEGAFDIASGEQAQAVVVLSDGEFFEYRARLADLALKSRLPTMYEWGEAAEVGGLLAYGSDRAARYRRAAYYHYFVDLGEPARDVASSSDCMQLNAWSGNGVIWSLLPVLPAHRSEIHKVGLPVLCGFGTGSH